MMSFNQNLHQQLEKFESLMMDLLDDSTITEFVNDPSDGVVFIGFPRYWWDRQMDSGR